MELTSPPPPARVLPLAPIENHPADASQSDGQRSYEFALHKEHADVPQPNHASAAPPAPGPCYAAPQLARVQERSSTCADRMEIFLPAVLRGRYAACPGSAGQPAIDCSSGVPGSIRTCVHRSGGRRSVLANFASCLLGLDRWFLRRSRSFRAYSGSWPFAMRGRNRWRCDEAHAGPHSYGRADRAGSIGKADGDRRAGIFLAPG